MNIGEWLVETMRELKEAGVDSPRRDALVLLEDVLGKDRAWVTTHPEYEISEQDLVQITKLIQQRVQRVPLAYIRGKVWFYGRFFAVNEHTLIPRPESENFIELLKEIAESGERRAESFTVADVGTGSGVLAITTKLELPSTKVIATDISLEALKVAKKNAHTQNLDIIFLCGFLLDPLITNHYPLSAIVANLPYVPNDMITSPEITQEPAEALFSGTDGLDHYRNFWQQLKSLDTKPLHILTESLESQHHANASLAHTAGYTLEKTSVLIQQFKPT